MYDVSGGLASGQSYIRKSVVRGIAAAAAIASLGLGVSSTAQAAPSKVTYGAPQTSTAVVKTMPVTSAAALIAEAKQYTPATLHNAPAAVQKFLTTPYKEVGVSTIRSQSGPMTATQIKAVSPGAVQQPSASTGKATTAAIPQGYGWAHVPPGCYTWYDGLTWYNYIGWKLYEAGQNIYNWCENGYTDYTTPWSANFVWDWSGYNYCGSEDAYAGWKYTNWGWVTGITDNFGYIECLPGNIVLGVWVQGEVWGDGNYDHSWS